MGKSKHELRGHKKWAINVVQKKPFGQQWSASLCKSGEMIFGNRISQFCNKTVQEILYYYNRVRVIIINGTEEVSSRFLTRWHLVERFARISVKNREALVIAVLFKFFQKFVITGFAKLSLINFVEENPKVRPRESRGSE
jgi:hypothetical protein